VICEQLGFTESHQTIIDYGNMKKARNVAETLQRANIITDTVIRIGTCEVTRRGMKQHEMHKIAQLLKRTVIDKEKPETIKKEVANLSAEFQKVKYCFNT
jgi:glycine hydroxymethyltransferase